MSWVSVIEAAYRLDGTTNEWLERISATLYSLLGDGLGACGLAYSIDSTGHLHIEAFQSVEMSPELVRAVFEINKRASPEAVTATYLSHVVGTPSNALPPELYEEAIAPGIALGVRDALSITCCDPTPSGIGLIVPQRDKTNVARRVAALGERVAAHVTAGARLRKAVTGDLFDGAEAILDLRGRFQHAEGSADDGAARNTLHEAAVAIDRARARGRNLDELEATEMWQALVAGRWTVIDRVDTDGKRLFVARKNDPSARRYHRLTERERQVVGYAVRGHSNKLIAYELGLADSAVASHLTDAITKLGFASRAELIQAAASLGVDTED